MRSIDKTAAASKDRIYKQRSDARSWKKQPKEMRCFPTSFAGTKQSFFSWWEEEEEMPCDTVPLASDDNLARAEDAPPHNCGRNGAEALVDTAL